MTLTPAGGAPSGSDALTHRDDGTIDDPTTPDEWDAWVSAGRTRNYCADDTLLDWLDRHGREHGFVPTDELPDFDPRTDFSTFILERGQLFEEKVLELIRGQVPTTRVGDGWREARDLERAESTVAAMRSGDPVIEQAVLRNPESRTYGSADLLIRSDVLNELVPGTLAPAEAAIGAPALGDVLWHYRVVDIKFTTLDLLKDGHAGSGHLAYMAQVWVYNEALGRIQGYRPPASFLLGRCWKASSGRGTACLDRLARVDHHALVGQAKTPLAEIVTDAMGWIRRLRKDGATWQVLPIPAVPELYPHMRNDHDERWHRTKGIIAEALAELTLLPGMNPTRRRHAHGVGLLRWDDPGVSAATLGLSGDKAIKCDQVLLANDRSGSDVVVPPRISKPDPSWRQPAALELYVDFETVSNLADDFSRLPDRGGQELIFQIGCGWYEGPDWRFWQRTVPRLDVTSEAGIIDAWIEHIDDLLAARGLGFTDLRIVHWSPAETSSLDTAYNAARTRHPGRAWPDLPWFDVLQQVIRAEPVAVRGAFKFGLKPIGKAMYGAGLITTDWTDGPTDGLGAMIGAWWCDAEAARLGTSMEALPLMQEIAAYNEVDCKVMAEVLGWLRANR